MKFVLISSIVIIFAGAFNSVLAAKNNRLSHIDIEAVLSNERLLNVYLRCLLENKGCNAQGTELKRIVPDAIKTACGSCSEQQRTSAFKVIRHLIKEKPMTWDRLLNKYDPKKIYRTKWDSVLAKEGIHI